MHQIFISYNYFFERVPIKRYCIFLNSLIFPVPHDNIFYHCNICVNYLSVRLAILLSIHIFCEFHILMKLLQIYACFAKLICMFVSLNKKL